MLSGQPELSDQPPGRAEDLRAAASVYLPGGPAGVRRQQRLQAGQPGRAGVSGRDGGRLLRMAVRVRQAQQGLLLLDGYLYTPPGRPVGPCRRGAPAEGLRGGGAALLAAGGGVQPYPHLWRLPDERPQGE